MPTCPRCKASERQVKAGLNRTGSQRFLCRACGCGYTPEPKPSGYEEPVRRQALALYAGGMSVRAAGRLVGVTHQTVSNWVEAAFVLSREAPSSGAVADDLIAQVAARRRLAK